MTAASNALSNVSGKGILDIFGRPKVEGLYYNGKSIPIDGYSFIGCRFDRCALHIASLNFDFIGCIIDEASSVHFSAELLKPIQLFNFLANLHSQASKQTVFYPTYNADGTITISTRPI